MFSLCLFTLSLQLCSCNQSIIICLASNKYSKFSLIMSVIDFCSLSNASTPRASFSLQQCLPVSCSTNLCISSSVMGLSGFSGGFSGTMGKTNNTHTHYERQTIQPDLSIADYIHQSGVDSLYWYMHFDNASRLKFPASSQVGVLFTAVV